MAKLAEAKQASIDEHAEVLAAVDALKAQLANVVPPEAQAAALAAVDDLKGSIVDTFTPDAPPAPPAPPATP